MDKTLNQITTFLRQHHTLCLSTCKDNLPFACTVFYAYNQENNSFIIASNINTQHIQNGLLNPNVAGTVYLSTNMIGKIQGVQFRGKISKCKNYKKIYFKKFPYALAMNPTLWNIKITYFKMTDNRLGFGKKLIWK